ncbi:cytochrome b5-like heme/steroid binding domain-containing protein, partial [Thamnocephalis sphaerospora]
LQRKEHMFSEAELARYDGTDPSLPIYVAINGEVFDVTDGREFYGPGGGYHFFAGRDAARAYVTGCFKTHLTHDLRGLTNPQLEQLKGWVSFYHDSPKYFYVGRVVHAPISANAPIPEDCNDAAKQKP